MCLNTSIILAGNDVHYGGTYTTMYELSKRSLAARSDLIEITLYIWKVLMCIGEMFDRHT